MKLLSLTIAGLLLATVGYSQNYNITYRSKVEFPGQVLANIWGFALNGKEYALVGAAQGMVIVDVTNPDAPTVITQLTDGITSSWREIKTYGNYAYVTSEGQTVDGLGGVGIANLSNLPNPNVPFHKYHGDGVIANQLKRAHSLHVDTDKGYAYIFGTTGLANKGAVCLNLNVDPYNPIYVGQYNTNYIHDGIVKNDTLYGAHIYAGYFSVINFTNKSNPQLITTVQTPNIFTHNTWLSENGNYLFTTDETSYSYLAAYNINDINNIVETDRIQTTPGSGSIVHNTYVKSHYAVTSWYKDGVTITDVNRPSNLIQVGRYDTYPTGSGSGFNGAWGVYPYLPSGNLLVTNISESLPGGGTGGVLYVLTPSYMEACYLEGNIKDANTNQNLNAVSVAIQHTDPLNSTTSSFNGNYATGQPTSGTFNVVFSKPGYNTQTVSAVLAPGEVTTLNVLLQQQGLPLELVSFSAWAQGKENILEWATAQEKNTLRHEIEVNRLPGVTWEKIGEVAAAGESTTLKNYSFTDEQPARESHYRIRTVDLDGSEHLSDVAAVIRPFESFELGNIYPVPTTGILKVEISSDRSRDASLSILNISGMVLMKEETALETGSNNKIFELPSEWPSGQYWLRIVSENETKQGTFILRR